MARLVTRLTSFSTRRTRTPVSAAGNGTKDILLHALTDVIVLTAMGEEAAIDAKEAPKGA